MSFWKVSVCWFLSFLFFLSFFFFFFFAMWVELKAVSALWDAFSQFCRAEDWISSVTNHHFLTLSICFDAGLPLDCRPIRQVQLSIPSVRLLFPAHTQRAAEKLRLHNIIQTFVTRSQGYLSPHFYHFAKQRIFFFINYIFGALVGRCPGGAELPNYNQHPS